jgi:limonene-1,2-epoxide hydrolase
MAGLPCSGRIVKLTVRKDVADATFVLGTRKRIKCDAPGIKARGLFRVRKGKIVAWAQVAVA